VHPEASTKPHVHRKFEIFWTNIASTMACPNFKNGPKMGLGPLGVNIDAHEDHLQGKPNFTSFWFVVEDICLKICLFSQREQLQIFCFKVFFVEIFFHMSSTKFPNILSTNPSCKTHPFCMEKILKWNYSFYKIIKTFFCRRSSSTLITAFVKSAHAMSTWLFHIFIN
jgi:hypothetical protein